MSTVTVRPMRREDLAGVWDLLQGLARYEKLLDSLSGSAERLGEHLFGGAEPRVHALVAEREGALVGYALFYLRFSSFRTRPTMWLEDLYVLESGRQHGTGRALLSAVARRSLELDCIRLEWAVLDWNEPAVAFYQRMGAAREQGWDTYGLSSAALERLASGAGEVARASRATSSDG